MSFVWMNSFFNKSTLRDYAIVLKVKFLSMSMHRSMVIRDQLADL